LVANLATIKIWSPSYGDRCFWLPSFSRRLFGVLYFGLVIYIKKYPNAKEELWKFQYFIVKKYNI
jgi:hypothetical protein